MTKIKVISLFSGGGGLDLGFKRNNYDIIWAVDNDKNAVETYKKNIGNHIICADVNDISVDNIPKADIVIGGPPCQSFSLIGKRQSSDMRGKLVWKYLEIIEKVMPKTFLFENVIGLLSAKNGKGEKILDLLIKKFKDLGYTVSWKVLNSADYGVPQLRKRVIVIGIKGTEKFEFPFPTHSANGEIGLKKHISVKEALGDIHKCSSDYTSKPSSEYQKLMRKNNKILTNHTRPTESELDTFIIRHVPEGGNYNDIPSTVNSKRIQRLKRDGGHTTCYGRMSSLKPSYTINTYFNRPNVGCNIHYSEDRLITAREALRLQSFPDSFEVISSSKQGINTIIGNAVPPLLASTIAKHLEKYMMEEDRTCG